MIVTNSSISGTYLLTGATSGFGLEIAKTLIARGADHIITGVRDRRTAANLQKAIPPEKLTILSLDLISLASTRNFCIQVAQRLGSRGEALSAILCIAGLQMIGPKTMTEDGIEATFAVNYLSHFLLAESLRPHLVPGGTVVVIGSGTHNPDDPVAKVGGFRGTAFPSAEEVSQGEIGIPGNNVECGQDRYAASKLCCILYAREMAKHVPETEVRYFSFDPGLMPGTNLARERNAVQRFVFKHVLPISVPFIKLISSPKKSARMVVDGILAGGGHFNSGDYVEFTGELAPRSSLSLDDEKGASLIALSERLTQNYEPEDVE